MTPGCRPYPHIPVVVYVYTRSRMPRTFGEVEVDWLFTRFYKHRYNAMVFVLTGHAGIDANCLIWQAGE